MRPLQALDRSAVLASLIRAVCSRPSISASVAAARSSPRQPGALGCDMRVFQSRGSFGGRIVVALLAVMIAACDGSDEKSESQAGGPSGGGAPPPVVPPTSSTDAATLDWLPPLTTTDGATLTNLAGYRIYYGTDVTQLSRRIEVQNPGVVTYVIEGLAPATYYFAVTAVDANGAESARSNAGRKDIG